MLQLSKILANQAKATFLYAESERQKFSSSKAVLLISVGQVAHEGEKLAATIDLANRSFSSCDVAVCDSLQRHTMQIGNSLSSEELYFKANVSGEEWIKRNQNSLQFLSIQHRIFRWDEYLLDPNFNACKEKMIEAYEKDEQVKNAMHQTIKEFIERFERRASEIDTKIAFDCCFNYLIEECAIMMLMWPKCQYNYIIYPSGMIKVVEAARDKFVSPFYPELLKWLRVRVRTREEYKASAQPSRILINDELKYAS